MSPFDRPSAPPAHPSVTSPRWNRPTSLQCGAPHYHEPRVTYRVVLVRINSQKSAGNSLRHLGEKFRRLGGLFYGEVGANEASCQQESRGGANGGRLAVELRGGGHVASPVSAYRAEVFQHVTKKLPCPCGHLPAAQPRRRAPRPRKCSTCANDESGPRRRAWPRA